MNPLFKITLVGLLLLATSPLGRAQTITFANFTQKYSGTPPVAPKVFEFVNTGNAATTGFTTTTLVNFTFLVNPSNPAIPVGTPIDANLTITSLVDGFSTGNFVPSQKLKSVQISFTGTGALAGQNLLTVFASTGILSGSKGSATANLEETDNGSNQIVQYSSAFLDFSTSNQQNYSISLNNIDSPGLVHDSNFPSGYLSGFQANASGQFASNAAFIPEPSTFALLSLGGLGLLRKRKK